MNKERKEKYIQFLKNKAIIADVNGIDPKKISLSQILKPHQKDIAEFCLEGGQRAIFGSFGVGKTVIQLQLMRAVMQHTGKPGMIVCPLGVRGEFRKDNLKFNDDIIIEYITDSNSIDDRDNVIYITNYERIRQGNIDARKLGGISFDEASILRNLKTQTTNELLDNFRRVPFRFVATATPSPNDYIEIINYAEFLDVASRGHLLTRFFQRDSTKAGHLTLYPHKKEEFWQWVSTWAVFINSPSDLGYDGGEYELPEMEFIEHIIHNSNKELPRDKRGEVVLFKNAPKSLVDVSKEKRDSINARVEKAMEIVSEAPSENWILWHHLNPELEALETVLKGKDFVSVYGSQDNDVKEKNLIDFADGKYQFLLSKPKIAGQGCNFQYACSRMIFVGIDFKFNDFIQAVHRVFRFMQREKVSVHVILTDSEYEVLKELKRKWEQHKSMQEHMIALVREYGLNRDFARKKMERQMFKEGNKFTDSGVTLYNGDSTIELSNVADNSQGLIVTSIPFGNHYEYSDKYNDFGHNSSNREFFKQMDFLIPELIRVLKPGRVAAIHVKDRIQYSHQTGKGFTSISDFSGQTVRAFEREYLKDEMEMIKDLMKKGIISDSKGKAALADLEQEYRTRFTLIGKITITTDVVAENNQTYRLGWTEKCKDGSKMGVGLPEYVLLFRKDPSSNDNSYSDEPVKHSKFSYSLQIEKYAGQKRNANKTAKEIKKGSQDHCIVIETSENQWYAFGYTGKQISEIEVLDKIILEELNKPASQRNMNMLQDFFVNLFGHSPNEDVYSKARWQLDAHSYWRSSGDRFMSQEDLKSYSVKSIVGKWKEFNKENIYEYFEHLKVCEVLDEAGKLSSTFMTLPVHSNNEMVWTDINRMHTLNANQVQKRKEKHICPLQIDIIERLIETFSAKGDSVLDPFGGLFSTPVTAIKMGRDAVAIELNSEYFQDGVYYVRATLDNKKIPTLFDFIKG
ncbi:MAG TPA: DNA methyltransferase [Leptospiraceae bacterium]|nr:DNA methyltransferase [Leptospiraceae bacterium]